MGLYEEAIKYKKLAENALRRGDVDSAKRYLNIAIQKIEQLEAITEDPSLRAIWAKAKMHLKMLLDGVKSGAITSIPKSKETQKQRIVQKRKVKKSISPREIPEICKADFLYTSVPNIKFDDVADLDDVKRELKEGIEWQIKYRDLLEKLGLRPIKGILLFGPPGTGKTFIVKAAAGEFKIPLIIVDPATLMSKWLGESEKMVSQIFACARQIAPAIIFIDEVDKVFPLQTSGSDAPKRIEAQLLQEIDGIKENEGFIVIFASNEPWNLNPALIRANRIDKLIYVGPPDKNMRKKLFELYLKGVKLAEDVDLDKLAELTAPNDEGFYSSAAIALICNEAKKNVLRYYEKTGELRPLTMKDLVEAINSIRRDIPRELYEKYEAWKKKYFVGGVA